MRAALGCFAIGLVLMIGFDYPLTRVLGVLLLFAFIVSGVFALATPDRLDQGD